MAAKVKSCQRIREIMNERGLRQVDVVERAQPFCKMYDVKFSKSTLSQYLSGSFEPAQDKLFILGLVFDVNEAWLMGFDVPKERGSYLLQDSFDPSPKMEELFTRFSMMIQPAADRYVELFLNILRQDSLKTIDSCVITQEDQSLISAWHRADPKEKRTIAGILEEYGFYYLEEKQNETNAG